MVLSSCIDGDEEIFLNADGSASMKVIYSLPALMLSDADGKELRQSIQDGLGNDTRIDLVTNTVERVDGRQVITVEVATENLLELEGLTGGESDPNQHQQQPGKSEELLKALLGEFIVNRDGLTASINRKVDLTPLLEKYLGARGPSILGDSEFRYTIHFPNAVDASNAHEVTNNGKTVMWKYKLRECAEKPIELDIVASVPLPWWIYVTVGLVVIAVIWIGWKLISKKTKSREIAGV